MEYREFVCAAIETMPRGATMAVERICAPHMRMRSAATGDAIEKALLNTVACGMKLPERDTGKRTQSSKKQWEDSCWTVASGNGIQSVSDNLSGGIL